MHGEAQCRPLVPLGEQCCAPNSTTLVVSTWSLVSQGGEVLWGSRGFVLLIFMCMQSVHVHYCFYMCVLVLIHHCFYVCRFQEPKLMKFNARWSSTHAISFFRWAISCPWPNFVGVFYFFMCFSWSWLVCEALIVSHLLFLSMIKTLMFYVCTLFCVCRF